MQKTNDSDIRALRAMVEEVRTSIPPDLDWDAIERRTLDHLDVERLASERAAAHARASRGGGLGVSLVFALAAAAIVMMILGQAVRPASSKPVSVHTHAIESLPLTPARAGLPGGRLAAGVAIGDRIAATTTRERLVWPGVASVELAPGAIVRLARAGEEPRLELERGSVQAEVITREDATAIVEALVIDAGGARVAAHGTSFSLLREGERVLVEVGEGVVTVGPAGQRGPTVGTLLRGPGRAAFSAQTGALLEELEPSTVAASASLPSRAAVADTSAASTSSSADTPAASASAAAAAPRYAAPSPTADTTASMAAEEPAAGPSASASTATKPAKPSLAAARALLVGCLSAETSDTDSALRVTAASEVRLRLDTNGAVASVRFVPPLRPDLQERCGSLLFGLELDAPNDSPTLTVEFKAR